MFAVDGHYYYRYLVGDLGKELKSFGIDIDTGDIIYAEWTPKHFIITPLNEWSQNRERKANWEKIDADKRKQEQEKAKRLRGLQVLDIKFKDAYIARVTVKNVSDINFSGGYIWFDVYGYNGVSLKFFYIVSDGFKVGETFYNDTLYNTPKVDNVVLSTVTFTTSYGI